METEIENIKDEVLMRSKGFKKTKVGWIPKDWKVKSLGNCSKDKPSYGINASAVPFSKDLPRYLRITDIDESGRYSPVKEVSVNDSEWENFLLEENDLLFVRTGSTTGKSYLYNTKDGQLVFAGFLIKFCLNPTKLLPNYMKLFSETSMYYKWVSVMSVRSGQPGINSQEFASLQIPLPPLPEQKKIAEILSTWDEAIESSKNLIEKLKLRKKGLMQQLLTGKKRLSGFDGEWEEVRFNKVFKERVEYPEESIPLYSLTIEKGVTPKTERYERSFLVKNKHNAYKKVCYQDFVLNPMNLRFGAIALYKEDKVVSVSKYYNVFSTTEQHDPYFLEYYLQSYNMICYYNAMAIGSLEEKKRVHFSDFKRFKKKLPSKVEQLAISEVLKLNDQEIKASKEKLLQLETQKKGLMQQLLTGQLRVSAAKND